MRKIRGKYAKTKEEEIYTIHAKKDWNDPVRQHFFPLTGGCSEGLGAFRFFFKKGAENIKY